MKRHAQTLTGMQHLAIVGSECRPYYWLIWSGLQEAGTHLFTIVCLPLFTPVRAKNNWHPNFKKSFLPIDRKWMGLAPTISVITGGASTSMSVCAGVRACVCVCVCVCLGVLGGELRFLSRRSPQLGRRSHRTLLGAPGIDTRSKKLLGAPGLTTRNKKLLETRIQ